MAFVQMGPSEIVDPIVGPPARGGLSSTVEYVEPKVEASTQLDRAERALKAAQEALEAIEEPAALEMGRNEIEKLQVAVEKAAKKHAASRRWENGYVYRPLGGCAEANVWAPCAGMLKRVDPTAPLVNVIPFTVYAGFTCSTWALAEEERIAHAEIRLNARESQAVEDELWHGTLATAEGWPNPVLAGPATVQLTPGATTSPLPYALGSLQDAIRVCLGSEVAGVIHATPMTVALWAASHMVWRNEDGRLRDLFGNLIVAGAGYDGASPLGVVDPTGRTAWAYATGPVRVMAGPVYITPDDTAEAVQRDTNDVTWRAERSISAAFDPCCLYGINVDLCNSCCGTPPGS